MATTVNIRTGYDTWVSTAGKNPGDNRLRLKASGGAATQYAYLYLPLGPELRNVTVTSATLHLWGVGTGWGSQTLTVERVATPWDDSTLTWGNKPSVAGAPVTRTQGNPDNPTEWLVDVTPLVQAYASGARWYGMRLAMLGATTERLFRSLDAPGKSPYLEVEWTNAPAAPVDLSPSGGLAVSVDRPVLTWSNADNPDATSLVAFRVHIEPVT